MIDPKDWSKFVKFVMKHTDENCGLNVANVNINQIHDTISIIVTSKKPRRGFEIKKAPNMKGMKEEWRGQAEDLILELDHDPNAGYGGFGIKFEIYHLADTWFEIREILKMEQ